MGILRKIISRPAEKANILSIDFNAPWTSIFFKQKLLIISSAVFVVIDDALNTFLPLALGLIINSANFIGLYALIAAFVFLEIAGWFTFYPAYNRFVNQTCESFRYNAFKNLLAIDPIYHVQRPSGAVIGKIHRTTNAFIELIDVAISDLLPYAVELLTLFVSMFAFNFNLGLLVTALVSILTVTFCIIAIKYTYDIERDANKKDDIVHQKNVESLSQFQFIRSAFATDQVIGGLKYVHVDLMKSQINLYMSYRIIKSIFIALYFIALGVIAYYLVDLVQGGEITPLVATSLAVTFLRGTKGIFKIDNRVKTVLRSYRLIQDFYSFIHVFGKQTYPIFEDDKKIKFNLESEDYTNIEASSVTFAYPGQPPIFKNNSLNLHVLNKYKNKLFGLIGPSGIGKTTILSILGGQLKPEEGQVLINGVDIYKVDDAVRRRLIAIQGQVATSLRGTLRFNALFGLPNNHGYSDNVLIDLLEAVGLWKIFAKKEGLNTFIGEGGLNLSGGQRQRLNFANLYLRAKFYKPLLILIDEPTSSLDEISEKAITEMIEELAATSVTFVIAHRLKTLEDAYEILDFSLIEPGSALKFYKPDELKAKSEYFRQLLEGTTLLEE